MDRLNQLRQLAAESIAAAESRQWDSAGHNPAKTRLLVQAEEAIRKIASIDGVEPGDVAI